MSTECFDVTTNNGRTVAVWRDSPSDNAGTGPIVVMAPGFGQRMRSSGVLALMLVYNGATVYRFDALDHVGISDGEIVDYSVTELMQALTAVVDNVRKREGWRPSRWSPPASPPCRCCSSRPPTSARTTSP